MVMDDRLKVWDDVDQPHVQVVPAFSPYRASLAEVCFCINLLPTLCNVLMC